VRSLKTKYPYSHRQFRSSTYPHKTTVPRLRVISLHIRPIGKVLLKIIDLLGLNYFTLRPSLVVVRILRVTRQNFIGGKNLSHAHAHARTHARARTHTHTHTEGKNETYFMCNRIFFESDWLWNNYIKSANSPEMSDCLYNFTDNRNYITKASTKLTTCSGTPIDLKTLKNSRKYGSYSSSYPTWNSSIYSVPWYNIYIVTSPDEAQG
jgi:hypothetical protein